MSNTQKKIDAARHKISNLLIANYTLGLSDDASWLLTPLFPRSSKKHSEPKLTEPPKQEVVSQVQLKERIKKDNVRGIPFKRRIRVFSPEAIVQCENFASSARREVKQNIEENLKLAKAFEGYRELPVFKRKLAKFLQLKELFPNFGSVIEAFGESMMFADASKAEAFFIQPTLLDGPPGVGKTAFAQEMAELLGLPFTKIAAGGLQHAFDLTGTSAHWGTSHPGVIFNSIACGRSASAIVLLDEVDKLQIRADYGILPALLDLLEPESARRFRDESVKLAFDASRIVFLLTSNSTANIDKALLSRCKVFSVGKPNENQRMGIAERIFNKMNNAVLRNNRKKLDLSATRLLAQSDIDIRVMIQAVRAAFARALRMGSAMVVPELPDGQKQSSRRPIGFVH